MMNAQKNFSLISSPEELQARLLIGDTFRHIASIESDGLNDLYNVLLSGKIGKNIYSKDTKIKHQQKQADSELSKLRQEKIKLERALDRLTNLYLYSEDAMSESEFIIQKTRLADTLDEINEQIGLANTNDWQQSVSDELLMHRASEFIINLKLTDRNYINYKRLATTTEAEILRNFFISIIDSIIMDAGRVKQIIFKNGLSHTFVFRDE